jgi:hypothetical protein
MAGTDRDSTTSADWRPADAELAFVTELVGTEARAIEIMNLLLDDLAEGLIGWDCDNLTVNGDFQAYPALRTTYATARGRAFFWHRDEHSRVSADWPRSCVAWMGPLAGFGSDGRGNSWPIFDPYASTSLTASGVRFHHGDFVDRLAARGLMPSASAPPPESTPIAPEVEAAPAAASSPPSLTAQEVTPAEPKSVLDEKKKYEPAQAAIAEAAKKIYSPDGIVPPGVGPAGLMHEIEKLYKCEAAAKKEKSADPPKLDSCRRFLIKQRGHA